MKISFESLAQRGMHYFMVSMPSFRAVESEWASEKEQKNAYHFIHGCYEKINNAPELFGMKIHADDCYPFWWSKRSDKPGLPPKIRSYIKNTNIMIEAIYHIVYLGEADGDIITLAKDVCEIKPAMLKKLAHLGIVAEKGDDRYRFAFPEGTVKGLKLLALISEEHSRSSASEIHNQSTKPFLLLSHGVFDPRVPYTAEIFRKLFENRESYDRLIEYFDKEKYIRVDNKEYKTGINCDVISLDYVRFYGKPEGVIGSSWKTRNFSGISFSYDELNEDCTTVGIHIPYFYEVLQHADQMTPSLRGFIANWNKCGGCRYCVQMDKSKTKPLRFVKINEKNICTVFTGGYTFNQFYNDTWLADGVIELMEFVHQLFADKRVIPSV